MNRFAFIVCKENNVEFVIPEINLRGSEPTENVDDVLSLLINCYNVTEYEVIQLMKEESSCFEDLVPGKIIDVKLTPGHSLTTREYQPMR